MKSFLILLTLLTSSYAYSMNYEITVVDNKGTKIHKPKLIGKTYQLSLSLGLFDCEFSEDNYGERVGNLKCSYKEKIIEKHSMFTVVTVSKTFPKAVFSIGEKSKSSKLKSTEEMYYMIKLNYLD